MEDYVPGNKSSSVIIKNTESDCRNMDGSINKTKSVDLDEIKSFKLSRNKIKKIIRQYYLNQGINLISISYAKNNSMSKNDLYIDCKYFDTYTINGIDFNNKISFSLGVCDIEEIIRYFFCEGFDIEEIYFEFSEFIFKGCEIEFTEKHMTLELNK